MDNRYVQQFKKRALFGNDPPMLDWTKKTYGYEIDSRAEQSGNRSAIAKKKEWIYNLVLYRLQEAELIQCRFPAPAAAKTAAQKKYYSLPTSRQKEVLEELIEFWANLRKLCNGFIATYQQCGGVIMKEQYIKQVEKESFVYHATRKSLCVI